MLAEGAALEVGAWRRAVEANRRWVWVAKVAVAGGVAGATGSVAGGTGLVAGAVVRSVGGSASSSTVDASGC